MKLVRPTIRDTARLALDAFPELKNHALVVAAPPADEPAPPLSLAFRSRLMCGIDSWLIGPLPIVGRCLAHVMPVGSLLFFDPHAEPRDGDLVLVTVDRGELADLIESAWSDYDRRPAISGLVFETLLVKSFRVDRSGRPWLVAIEPEGVTGALLCRGTIRGVLRYAREPVRETRKVDHAAIKAMLAGR